mgnify:CR=1 FL=1
MKKKFILIIIFSLSIISSSFGAGSGGSDDGSSNYDKGASLIKRAKKLEKKGKVEKAKKRYEKALKYLSKSNKKKPNDPDTLNYLGFALRKLGGFTMVFAFICTVASIVRVPSSLNPKGPVSISSVEYGTLLIPTAGFWLFGVGKIREHLNCNWAKNTEKRGSNLVYSSENTTNNDPGSNNSNQATPQNSSPYVVKKGDAKAPPTADNSQQQVV